MIKFLQMPRSENSGFSLIEILVVMAVLAGLSTIALQSLRSMNANTALETDSLRVLSELEHARSRTLASEDDSQYGLRFENSRIILFKGATYNELSPDNIVTQLNRLIRIASTTLAGGGSNIIFDRITGKTAQNGSVRLSLIADDTASSTIRIDETGVADIQ